VQSTPCKSPATEALYTWYSRPSTKSNYPATRTTSSTFLIWFRLQGTTCTSIGNKSNFLAACRSFLVFTYIYKWNAGAPVLQDFCRRAFTWRGTWSLIVCINDYRKSLEYQLYMTSVDGLLQGPYTEVRQPEYRLYCRWAFKWRYLTFCLFVRSGVPVVQDVCRWALARPLYSGTETGVPFVQ
jgi:hypothetical protein